MYAALALVCATACFVLYSFLLHGAHAASDIRAEVAAADKRASFFPWRWLYGACSVRRHPRGRHMEAVSCRLRHCAHSDAPIWRAPPPSPHTPLYGHVFLRKSQCGGPSAALSGRQKKHTHMRLRQPKVRLPAAITRSVTSSHAVITNCHASKLFALLRWLSLIGSGSDESRHQSPPSSPSASSTKGKK